MMVRVSKLLLLLLILHQSLGDECHNFGFECSGPSRVRQCVDGVVQGQETTCKDGFICDASEEFGPCVRTPSQTCCQEGTFPVKDNCRGFMICIHNGLHLFQYNGACAPNYEFSPYELKCLPIELARCSSTTTPSTVVPPTTKTDAHEISTFESTDEETLSETEESIYTTLEPINTSSKPISNETEISTTESSTITFENEPINNTTLENILTTPIITTLKPISTTPQPISSTPRPILTTERPITTSTTMVTTTKTSVSTVKCTSPGQIADPSSCRHYIVCSWASQTTLRATKTPCTTGLFYDIKLRQCVYNTNCGARPR